MITSAPARNILVGISLDPEESKELLSWAIGILAHLNDNIVAIHVLVDRESKKHESTKRKKQMQIRQAKAHVISVLGDFAGTCQSKQINLEARVGSGSSVSRGLVEEAKSISADYLLLHGLRSRQNRAGHEVVRYCFEHAPAGCTVVAIGKHKQALHNSSSGIKESHQSSSRWLNKITNSNSHGGRADSPVEIRIESKTKSQNPSPRTVFDELEGESNRTEDDTFSLGDSSMASSPPLAPKFKDHENTKMQIYACKLASLFFGSPLKRRNDSIPNKEKKQPLLKCFSYEEIANATDNFHAENIVGQGGYSEVYRGELPDGRVIAVKRIAKDNKDAIKEKEFLTELGIIGHVCHPNTATLVGCCIENGLYLVFNFSQNGNLASALYGKASRTLEWPVRYKIALGVARGLHYLHKCCKRRIIHRDIKASNVLLGPDYEPQITDFGLAKWLPNKWTHHAVIPIEGTFGYLAPEYFMHGIVDEKTDVFAFGVLLLEIASGRRPVDSSKQNLLLWAKPLMESGKVSELADPRMEGKFDADQMYRLLLTASYCVRQSAIWRPSMSEVLEFC
uniref:Uncharacterized protein MANES_06G028500 n=1 Tax=Rhizophora mucronata TaxID=61149 RepID=A0A2P2K515_RHIMU